MFISRHTLKWTKTCRSSGDFPHAHTAHFLLNRHRYSRIADGAGFHAFRLRHGLVFRVVDEPHAGRRLFHRNGHGALTAPFPHGLRMQSFQSGPFLYQHEIYYNIGLLKKTKQFSNRQQPHSPDSSAKMLNSLKWAPDNIGGKGMPGEYPRRLGASPLRAKALFIMPKYVTTRNILMNVVTEFDRNSRCRFKPSRCRALLYKDVAHTLSRESGTFLNSYARHAMYPASFIIIPCALMAYRAIAQFGSAPALGAGCRGFKSR